MYLIVFYDDMLTIQKNELNKDDIASAEEGIAVVFTFQDGVFWEFDGDWKKVHEQ